MWCLLVQNPIFFFLFSEQNSTSFLKLHMILNLVDDPVIYCIGLSLVSCINKFSNAATYLKILRVLGSYAKKRHDTLNEDPGSLIQIIANLCLDQQNWRRNYLYTILNEVP